MFGSLGAPELLFIIAFILPLIVAPVLVTRLVLLGRNRWAPWKGVVVLLTGWLGAIGFIVIDR